MMVPRNLMIVQGGGPTAVFNASLAGAIARAQETGFGRIWGARAGSFGLSRADVIELTSLSAPELAILRNTPGAALGSTRYKPEEADKQRQLETLRSLDVHHVLFMGGNGSMSGALVLGDYCQSNGYEAQLIGVPKTVDNDLAATDRCPGYPSAARYVVQSTQELGLDIRSLPQPVTILETMGRSVGWLAAAAALACTRPDEAPQLIYIPEVAFKREEFLESVDRLIRTRGWAVVVVAEGIRNEDGSMVFETMSAGQQDALKRPMTGGVARYLAGVVGEELKVRCRSEIPGLLGRASMAHLSQQDQADAVLAGHAGVDALLAGETGKMIALTPLAAGGAGYKLVPLTEVAGVERTIPKEWLTGGPLAVSEEFRSYLQPLVGELREYAPAFARA